MSDQVKFYGVTARVGGRVKARVGGGGAGERAGVTRPDLLAQRLLTADGRATRHRDTAELPWGVEPRHLSARLLAIRRIRPAPECCSFANRRREIAARL